MALLNSTRDTLIIQLGNRQWCEQSYSKPFHDSGTDGESNLQPVSCESDEIQYKHNDLPVICAASAARNVQYDIVKNSEVSSSGWSLMCVYFVIYKQASKSLIYIKSFDLLLIIRT